MSPVEGNASQLPDHFLGSLRCPESNQALQIAPGTLLDRLRTAQSNGTLFLKSGKPVVEKLEALLVREDASIAYPVRNGIPVLIKEEAIEIGIDMQA